MNQVIADALKKGYQRQPKTIRISEFEYIPAPKLEDRTDGEVEFGEATLAYFDAKYDGGYPMMDAWKEFVAEMTELPENYTLHDAALYVLRMIARDC